MYDKSIAKIGNIWYSIREVITMNGLPKYYTILFNAVEEAMAALDRMNFGVAKTLLLRGQLLAEEEYMAVEKQREGMRGDRE